MTGCIWDTVRSSETPFPLPVCVLRSSPSAESVGFPAKKPVPLLTTNEQKLALLEEMGVEVVYLLPFDRIRDMEPEDFVEALYRICRVRALSCGFNFRFGKTAGAMPVC